MLWPETNLQQTQIIYTTCTSNILIINYYNNQQPKVKVGLKYETNYSNDHLVTKSSSVPDKLLKIVPKLIAHVCLMDNLIYCSFDSLIENTESQYWT